MENENQQQQSPSNGGGLKLMTVFIVVLALHVLVIGGVSAYSLLKGNTEPVALEENKSEKQEVTPATTETPALDSTAPVVAETNTGSPVIAPEATPTIAPVISAPEQEIHSAPITSTPIVESTIAPAMGTASSYQVAKGDTLSKIARMHGMKVADLKTLNGLKTDSLKIGQELKVKSGTSVASTASEPVVKSVAPVVAVSPAKSNTVAASNYVVEKGDTLTKIAKQYNTTPSAIMAANKLADARKLKIGMKLNIPSQSRQQVSEQTVPASTLEKSSGTSADFAMAK